jgi:hypothetical protein
MNKLKSRKLWATVLTLGIATAELHLGHLPGEQWRILVEALLAVYVGSTAAQNAAWLVASLRGRAP